MSSCDARDALRGLANLREENTRLAAEIASLRRSLAEALEHARRERAAADAARASSAVPWRVTGPFLRYWMKPEAESVTLTLTEVLNGLINDFNDHSAELVAICLQLKDLKEIMADVGNEIRAIRTQSDGATAKAGSQSARSRHARAARL